jgi:hypothetical protein
MSRTYAIVSLLVGLAMLLTFGWIGVDSILDLNAFPAAPTETTLPQLAALRDAPRGTWVRLAGDFELEAGPVAPDSRGPRYLLVRKGESRLVVAYEPKDFPRALTERVWTGVPEVHRTNSKGSSYRRLPHDLAFAGVDWANWADPRVVILWTHAGPVDSRIGRVLGPVLALVAALVVWYALSQLRPGRQTMDVVWPGAALPTSVRVSGFAGEKAKQYSFILFCLAVLWLVGFAAVDLTKDELDLRVLFALGFGGVLLLLAGALWLRARRASGHEYFARLLWLPVRSTYALSSEGIATGVMAYELDLPAGTKPSKLTVHSSSVHGGLVFRDASRLEILAAQPFHSSDVLVLSSTLREIRDNPLAPLSHPRHRLIELPRR